MCVSIIDLWVWFDLSVYVLIIDLWVWFDLSVLIIDLWVWLDLSVYVSVIDRWVWFDVCLSVVQLQWPVLEGSKSGSRETKMVYKFAYLPAGLFNRAQVCVHIFFL